MQEIFSEVITPLGGGSVLILLFIYILHRFVFPHWKTYLEVVGHRVGEYLARTYFCGYPVIEVYDERFFIRYRQYVDVGFCCAVSALTMIALRKNRTARLVEITYFSEKTKRTEAHRFVEFWMLGNWWIIDPCWLDKCLVLRRVYYKGCNFIQSTKVILTHKQFWSYKVSQQLAEKLSKPETSWQFYELWAIYAWYDHDDGRHTNFHPKIAELLSIWPGECPSPGFYIDDKDGKILFNGRIFREYMSRPDRLRPKAHTIRKSVKLKKFYQRAYKKFVAEEEAKASAQPPIDTTVTEVPESV